MDDATAEAVLAHIDAALEKNANIFHQLGAGLRGMRAGAAQVAHNQKSRAALQGAVNTLHAHGSLPMNVAHGVVQPLPMGVGVGDKSPGLLARAGQQLRGALSGAKQEFGATRAADKAVSRFRQVQQGEQELRNAAQVAQQHGLHADPLAGHIDYSKMTPAQYLQMHGHAVPAHHAPAPAAPAAAAPRAQAPTASAPAAQAPAAQTPYVPPSGAIPSAGATSAGVPNGVNPPAGQGWLSRNAAPLALAAGGAALGTSMLRGGPAAAEQDARMRDYMTNAQQNMATPMPTMAVYASYDEFAEEKRAAYAPVYPTMQGAMANSLANQLATKFVGEPIDAVQKVLKKKLYDEPKHRAAFQQALEGDEMLQAEHRDNPQGLADTFHTLKTFAPSIAKNPLATRTFLRQATMSKMHGTGPDFATIRLMTETEKFIQNAKGRGTP